MTETDFRIKTKLTLYRFERSSEELQINLVIEPNKTFKITICFSSKNYQFAFKKEKLLKIC